MCATRHGSDQSRNRCSAGILYRYAYRFDDVKTPREALSFLNLEIAAMATDAATSGRAVLRELEDASTAVRRKLDILEHFRDVFSCSGVQQPAAVDRNAAVPSLCRILEVHPPNLNYQADEANVLRAMVIEYFGRLPAGELPKSIIPQLMEACHSVLSTDTEDNGMVVHRVLFDIHKTYKQALEEQSGPFFSWLHQLYHNLPEEFAMRLNTDREPSRAVRADHSFRLASEVALMIVFLFQCYPRLLQANAEQLLPLMVKVASIPGPSLADVPDDNLSVYNDFRMAQIKSLAFLTVIARSQNLQALMQPHKEAICAAIVRVMQTVPDVFATRRELLIALRNIMATPFRSGLLDKMDVLLDEQVLLGKRCGRVNPSVFQYVLSTKC
jgi:hypothetical protein